MARQASWIGCDQADALGDRRFIAVQIGLGQPHADVAIQVLQHASELAAVLHVQAGAQSLFDDAHRAPDGAALLLHVLRADGAAGARARREKLLEQHLDQPVRAGPGDAGIDLHRLVQAGDGSIVGM